MSTSIDGFYSAYMSGTAAQGFAMLIFRSGKIVGAGIMGEAFDGEYYAAHPDAFTVRLSTNSPPNMPLIQGGLTGPQGEKNDLEFQIPKDFAARISFVFKHIADRSMLS